MTSFLDGFDRQLTNPFYESALEGQIDARLDFEFALEAATDVTLTAADYAAILNDNDPDSQIADMFMREESFPDAGAFNDPSFDSTLVGMVRQSEKDNQDVALENLIRESNALIAACEAAEDSDLDSDVEVNAANEADEPPTDPDENSDTEASAPGTIDDILEQMKMC